MVLTRSRRRTEIARLAKAAITRAGRLAPLAIVVAHCRAPHLRQERAIGKLTKGTSGSRVVGEPQPAPLDHPEIAVRHAVRPERARLNPPANSLSSVGWLASTVNSWCQPRSRMSCAVSVQVPNASEVSWHAPTAEPPQTQAMLFPQKVLPPRQMASGHRREGFLRHCDARPTHSLR